MFKVLACEVMRSEMETLLAEMGTGDAYDVEWLEMGLHNNPAHLHSRLKDRIAHCEGKGYAAIILAYGLCSNATAGLTPPSDSLLVVPRVHDCISVFLGSGKRYQEEHAAEPGTYWFTRSFIGDTANDGDLLLSGGPGTGMGGDADERVSPKEMERRFIEEYGEENAAFLMETLVQSWRKNYRRAVYLRCGTNGQAVEDARRVAACAHENEWRYEEMEVDPRLLRALLAGPWNTEEFAVVRPGQRLAAVADASALTVETDT